MKTVLRIAIFLCIGTNALAQGFNYQLTGNPLNTTGWISGGNSFVSGDEFILTDSLINQTGYIYYATPQSLSSCGQFTVSFDFRITNPSANKPADGISFWYLSDEPSDFAYGQGMGVPHNPNGLALYLDTYDDNSPLDIPLVSLCNYNGTTYTYSEGNATEQIAPNVTDLNFITDGNWHTCLLTYALSTVSVAFDGAAPIMAGSAALGNFNGYFGFSAATGASYSTQAIRNVSITVPPATTKLYVDSTATGANDGSSWANAFTTLSQALEIANYCNSVDSIFVAKGTYYPANIPPTNSTTTDRDKSFYLLRDSLAIIGGFQPGGAGSWAARELPTDGGTGGTILSGDIGIAGDSTDNTYHVVMAVGNLDSSLYIDGFYVSDGNASAYNYILVNGFNCLRSEGGGIYSNKASPQIMECSIFRNSAVTGGGMQFSNTRAVVEKCNIYNNTAQYGGGIEAEIDSVQIQKTNIHHNTAGYDGGGLYIYEGLHTFDSLNVYNNSLYSNNNGSHGGGIYNEYSNSIYTHINIYGNSSSWDGGGFYNNAGNPQLSDITSDSNRAVYGGGFYTRYGFPVLHNGKIRGNYASGSSGGMYCVGNGSFNNLLVCGNSSDGNVGGVSSGGDDVTFTNVTIAGNKAVDYGGLVTSTGPMIMKNSIIWGNYAVTGTNDNLSVLLPGTLTVTNSIIQSPTVYPGFGNMNTNPSFLAPEPPASAPTLAGDYHLLPCSPAIDAGDNAAIPAGVTTDLDNNDRIYNTIVDMGAYENQGSDAVMPDANGIVYVDSSAAPGGNGSSWGNAINQVADALVASEANTNIEQIWVAKGTYYPLYDAVSLCIGDNPRDKSFVLGNNVKLYGGFAGTETNISQRNWDNNLTILSGDIGVIGDSTDNAYHVVISINVDTIACINGFKITKGNADANTNLTIQGHTLRNNTGGGIANIGNSKIRLENDSFYSNTGMTYGGGIYNDSSNVSIYNCTIASNVSYNGAGLYNTESSSLIHTTKFIKNNANGLSDPELEAGRGGGISNEYHSDAEISNCIFSENYAFRWGGGAHNKFSSSPIFTNCYFVGNSSELEGGAVHNRGAINVQFVNCVFSGNYSATSGGAIFNGTSTCQVTNVTIAGNSAFNSGGPIMNSGTPVGIVNSIIYNNSSGVEGSTSPYSNSLIQGYAGGANGNIDGNINPAFIAPEMPISAPTISGDYRLNPCLSPAIDAGDNTSIPAGVTTDLDNNNRIFNTIVDMGAYENQIINVLTGTDSQTICNGGSYTFNGIVYTTSNNTATDTLSSSIGCDSIVTLHLTVLPSVTNTINPVICNGSTYQFGGIDYESTIVVTDTFTASNGCDSVVTMNLTVTPPITATENVTICAEEAAGFVWNGIANATDGTTFTTQISTGCDSITTLNLTILAPVTNSINPVICNGSTYEFGGIEYASTIVVLDTFTASNGCDSVVTMNLTVNPVQNTTANITICEDGLPYQWNGQNIPAGGNGIATFNTASQLTGCDSNVTLNLTVNPVQNTTANITICEDGLPYQWNGQSIPAGGNGVATFNTASQLTGCDSNVTLNLTVNPILNYTENITICNDELPYQWNGQSIPAGGNGVATFTTSSEVTDCDSTVTLNLTVHPVLNADDNITICSDELPFVWNGTTYNTVGTFSTTYTVSSVQYSCDSTTTLHLTVNPVLYDTQSLSICYTELPYSWNGESISTGGNAVATYTTVSATTGCDSITTLNLAVSPEPQLLSIDTAGCSPVLFEGQSYDNNAILHDTFLNAQGCDSIYRTVNITAHPNTPAPLSVDVSGCKEIIFEDSTYTASTVLQDTLHSIYGCDSILRTVNITVLDEIYDTFSATICMGEVYRFHDNDYGQTGLYTYMTTRFNGCDSYLTLNLTVNPLPDIHIEIISVQSHGLCIGDSVSLKGEGAQRYVWENGYGQLIGNTDTVNTILPEARNTVIVTGIDSVGCVDTGSVLLLADACCTLLMPNAFSPNGDGLNDRFGPVTYGHPEDYQMQIFNRWGQRVFVSYKAESQWDGTMNGQPANAGSYYYMLTGKCTNGEPLQQKGELILVR